LCKVRTLAQTWYTSYRGNVTLTGAVEQRHVAGDTLRVLTVGTFSQELNIDSPPARVTNGEHDFVASIAW
jgi:hypothetical protein